MFKGIKPTATFLFIVLSQTGQSLAVDTVSPGSAVSAPEAKDTIKTFFSGKIKYYGGIGGPAVKFSRYNGHFAVMTGGRGAGIINHGLTIGGGGYGIANSIPMEGTLPDTSRSLEMGYGGLEFGYVFSPDKIMSFGGFLLVGAGAIGWKSQPKSDNEHKDKKIFGVVEPTLYGVLTIFRFIGLNAGVSYRLAYGAESVSFKDRDLSDFSGYVGILFGRITSGKSIYPRQSENGYGKK
jgi:hypothetical protein